MQFICSDTSVWIDFSTISQLEIPFRLPYTYIMSQDAVDDELLSPPGLGKELLSYGLLPVEITIEEFFLAEDYGTAYPKLSRFDRVALAIAKVRQIILLTGDGPLRKAANKENVAVWGTLGILDQLFNGHYITADEYKICLQKLDFHNGGKVRLPITEILDRLDRLDR